MRAAHTAIAKSWREEARARRALAAEVERLTSKLKEAKAERESAVEILAREKTQTVANCDVKMADLTQKVCVFVLRLC